MSFSSTLPCRGRTWKRSCTSEDFGKESCIERRRVGGRSSYPLGLQLVSGSGAATVIFETDRDITERRRLEQEVLEILGAEQRRIGQDLHDGLCQHLTGTEFRAAVVADQLATVPEAQREIIKIGELIREGALVRRECSLLRGLSPVSLEAEGLMVALKELTEAPGDLFGNSCRFHCTTPVAVPDNVIATHLYRIAQEAISNAARHGRAKSIVVALDRTTDGIQLSIRDEVRDFVFPRVAPEEWVCTSCAIARN